MKDVEKFKELLDEFKFMYMRQESYTIFEMNELERELIKMYEED